MIKLNEPEIDIMVREEDVDVSKTIAVEASAKYAEIMARECKRDESDFKCVVTVRDSVFLPRESCGGIKIFAHNNKIVVSNTLADRLQLSYENLLPKIRKTLFPTPLVENWS